MKLNNEQQQFVNSSACNMLVSASAGSGKTTTMIEKLLNLIVTNKTPVHRLLVVTFTDAAAGEMKQKLYFRLQKYMLDNPSEDMEYLTNQMDGINSSDIGTIHSVCKKWITKYFYELGIDPNFKLIEGEEERSLFDEALENVINNYVMQEDEGFFEIFEMFNKKRNDQNFKNVITMIFNFCQEKQDVEQLKKNALKACETNLNKNEVFIYLTNYYKNIFRKKLDSIKDFKLTAQRLGLGGIEEYLGNCYNHINSLISESNIEKFITLLFDNATKGRLFVSKKETIDAQNFLTEIKPVIEEYKKDIKNAQKCYVNSSTQQLLEILNMNKKASIKLWEIVDRVEVEFENLKRNRNVLNFSDLQKQTIKLLQNNDVLEELRKSYDAVFIDEYQDVNQLQESIIGKVAENNSFYMIGDVKQSIYGFRQSNPEIFVNKYNLYKKNNKSNIALDLNENYRSSGKILNFCNYVFDELITSDIVGINYKKNARLYSGNENLKNSENSEVKICVIKKEKAKGEEDDSQSFSTNEAVEAEQVAKEVALAIGKNFYNAKENKICKINYKDIAILTRDNSSLVYEIVKALTKYKIPVNASFYQNIFNTYEVQMLYAFLKCVNNFCDDVAVAVALKSPVVGITDNELGLIKLNSNEKYFYHCVEEYANSGTNEKVKNKIVNFLNILQSLKQQMCINTIYKTMQEFVENYNLENYFYSFPNGEEMLYNCKTFLNILNNSNSEYQLTKCLTYLKHLESKSDFKINRGKGTGSVQVLTMHKSKGLEFPYVILCGLGKQFNKSIFSAEVNITSEFGIGLSARNLTTRTEWDSPIKNANKLKTREKDLTEQIRVLYVALTRAQHYLTLVGSYDFNNLFTLTNTNIFKSNCFFDFIFRCIPTDIRYAIINEKENIEIISEKNLIAKIEIAKPNLENQLPKTEIEFVNENENEVRYLKKAFEFNYKKNQNLIAVKNTVSGLLREEVDYENVIDAPITFGIGEGIVENEGAEFGVLIHTIMSKLNYTETLKDINEIINNVKQEKEFEESLFLKIDSVAILKAVQFVQSLLTQNSKIYKEKQFLLKKNIRELKTNSNIDEDILIQGVLDLLIISDNKAIVIDFKTNKNKTLNQLAAMYGLQLKLYNDAVINSWNVEVCDKYIYSIVQNAFIKL